MTDFIDMLYQYIYAIQLVGLLIKIYKNHLNDWI